MKAALLLAFSLTALLNAPTRAQDRDAKVRNDRQTFQGSSDWIYNNLDEGIAAARATHKPLMIVFRCIPCEACQEFDDDVAARDPIIRDLLDKFICVRIVQANTIDLARFQYDYDLSFAIVFMNADSTLYGRFGTRSARPEFEDISLHGLRAALEQALEIHQNYPANKAALAGKQPRPTPYKTPRDYPSLADKFGESIDYEGQTAKSCMHCHQIRDAERLTYRTAKKTIPDEILFPYPDPATIGLKMDPATASVIEHVFPESPAAKAGLAPGDELTHLDGQPLLSTADLQWVLHNTPSTSIELKADYRRVNNPHQILLTLPDNWRKQSDISWRVTTWELRRLALGGMKLEELNSDDRKAHNLDEAALALRVQHVGQYGDHAIAKNAGFLKDDIIIAFDGITHTHTESALIAHALQRKHPEDTINVRILRSGAKKNLAFKLP